MSILFSGDFHANAMDELDLVRKDILLEKYGQEKYDSIKYHIILGDGGFMWPNNKARDLYSYKILSCRPFPVLCVLGNHEPIYGMDDLPEADIGLDETVYQVNDKPFVAYLKRGKAYTIDEIKFLVLGGALSIDKERRIPDVTWWQMEYWTKQEKRDIFKLLKTENAFDCVISHTGPRRANKSLFGPYHPKLTDEVAILNDEIHDKIQFREWLCGHYHEDEYYYDKINKHGYHYLYDTTKILDKTDGKLNVYYEYGYRDR